MTHYINLEKNPFCPNGWAVEGYRKGPKKFKWDASRVSLYLDEQQKEGRSIQGVELRKQLEGVPVLNANVLDYLLAHPELIPDEWKAQCIFFWGTIYRGSDGALGVRCLLWYGGRWDWGCRWLGSDWGGRSPALVSAGENLGRLDLNGKVFEMEGVKYRITRT